MRSISSAFHLAPAILILGLTATGLAVGGCGPIVRPAPFPGATTKVTDANLQGPFDGQIVDALTGKPLEDAVVVGVWNFNRGDGFSSPAGSKTKSIRTDAAGRYRIPPLRKMPRSSDVRLVSFHLLVYKRGYQAYHSAREQSDRARQDFTARHNRIGLEKWNQQASHADHLFLMSPPREILLASSWERQVANQDLYRRLGGNISDSTDKSSTLVRSVGLENESNTSAVPSGIDPNQTPGKTPQTPPAPDYLLDASELLEDDDIRLRTGYEGEFVRGELSDFESTAYYHGVHIRAEDHSEDFDIAYRVWRNPPAGLDSIAETFKATLPGVSVSDEITEQSWIYEDESVRAIAFIDKDADSAVLMTCGTGQCNDLPTAIILAKFIHSHLKRIRERPIEQTKPASTESSQEGTSP